MIDYLNFEKAYSQVSLDNVKVSVPSLLAVDPYMTEYIPIHFFTNYLYMIDENIEKSGPVLSNNIMKSAFSSTIYSYNGMTRKIRVKEYNNIITGNGIIIDSSELKYCAMVSSKYVKHIYDIFWEYLLTESVAYERLIKPIIENPLDSEKLSVLNYLYTSLSYDFISSMVDSDDFLKNVLVYIDKSYRGGTNYNTFVDNLNLRFLSHNNSINESEKLIKSLCFCKIEINSFQDINGPEKELISLL